MTPRITVQRASGRAVIRASLGLSVSLIAVSVSIGTPEPADVRPTRIAATSFVGTPSLFGSAIVAPGRIGSTSVVRAPVVLPDAVTVAPALIESSAIVRAPSATVTPPGQVAPPTIPSASVVHAPTVGYEGAQTIVVTRIASTASVGMATIAAGAVSVAPSAISSSAVVRAPVVSAGTVTVSPAVIASASVVRVPVVTGEAAAPVALYLLPTLSLEPSAVWSPYKLRTSLSGSAIVTKNGVGTSFDVPVLADGAPDMTAASAYVNFDRAKGQVGTEGDLVASAGSPAFAQGYAIGGKHPVAMPYGAAMQSATLTGNGRATTVINVVARYSSAASGQAAEVALNIASPTAAGAMALLSSGPAASQTLWSGSPNAFRDTNSLGRSHPVLSGFLASDRTTRVLVDDRAVDLAYVNAAGTWTGLEIGRVPSMAYPSPGQDWLATLVYPGALTQADIAALQAWAAAGFDVLPTADAAGQIIIPGNSIVYGTGATYGLNWPRYLEGMVSRRLIFKNLGIFGQTAGTIYEQRARYIGAFDEGFAVNIIVAPDPTNDLGAGASGATCWNSYTKPFIQEAVAAGFVVLVPTTINRADGGWNPAKEAQRQDYLSRVRAETAGAGGVLLDFALDDGSIALVDNLHPSSPGYFTMATRAAPVVEALVPDVEQRLIADFTTGIYADDVTIGCTRSTEGSHLTLDGALQWFPPNVIRRTDAGVIIEGDTINYQPHSQDFFAADGWSTTNFGTSGTVALTPSPITAPDGSNSAARLSISASGGGQWAFMIHGLADLPAGTYTGSAWMAPKDDDAGKRIAFGRVAANVSASALAIPATLERVSVQFTSPGGGQNTGIGYLGGYGDVNDAIPAEVDLFGVMIEPGLVATSYVRTGNVAASRGADTLTLTPAADIVRLILTRADGSRQGISITPGATHTFAPGRYRTVHGQYETV